MKAFLIGLSLVVVLAAADIILFELAAVDAAQGFGGRDAVQSVHTDKDPRE